MGDRIALLQGDITKQAVDAIVNAANSSLLGGGEAGFGPGTAVSAGCAGRARSASGA